MLVLGALLKCYSQKRQIIHGSYCQMATLMMKALELQLLIIKKSHDTVSMSISSTGKIVHQLKWDNFFPHVKIICWTQWCLRAPSNSKYFLILWKSFLLSVPQPDIDLPMWKYRTWNSSWLLFIVLTMYDSLTLWKQYNWKKLWREKKNNHKEP